MANVKVALSADNAVLLLDAAAKAGVPERAVKTTTQGYFLVPEEVAEKAGVDVIDAEPKKRAEKPAKKAAAKRTAKKTTSSSTKEG